MKRFGVIIFTGFGLRLVTLIALSYLFFSFSGCKTSKQVVGEEKIVKADEAAPQWVNERPHNGAYYIGIGTCSKVSQPLDYQTIAKKNALNDLASEISVRVQGQTFLNTLEVNKNFSEEFISTISTSTDEKIENFEVAGIWENKKEYWTYYKLSKAEYQSQKQQKKNLAMNAAFDFYTKGKTAEEASNIPIAFDLYMRGLFAMKEYWDDVNEYSTESGKIFLENEIYGSLQRICDGLSIKSNSEKVILSSINSYSQNLNVHLEYAGKPARGITLVWSYIKNGYMKPKTAVTSDDGGISLNVSDVNPKEMTNQVAVSISLEPLMASDLDKNIQLGLLKTLHTEKKNIPIELVTPSFFVKSTEKNYGILATGSVLASAASAELTKRGMRISSSDTETDYKIEITSNTTEGGSTQGFVVAFLEMTIVVKRGSSGQIAYQETVSAVKGLQLNKDAASMEAYKKGKEKLEQQVVNSILDAIM